MKIKIKCAAGQKLEVMIFKYLKTQVFDNCFKELQHYVMFLLVRSIINDNYFPSP